MYTSIESINHDAPYIIDKLKRGEKLTMNEKIILNCYNTLNTGKSNNAGKRKPKNHNNNW